MSAGVVVSDNVFQFGQGSTHYGLFIRGNAATGANAQNVTITGNQFREYNTGIRLDNTDIEDVVGRGNLYKDCTTDTYDAGGTNIDLAAGAGVTAAYGTMVYTGSVTSEALTTSWERMNEMNSVHNGNGLTWDAINGRVQIPSGYEGKYLVTLICTIWGPDATSKSVTTGIAVGTTTTEPVESRSDKVWVINDTACTSTISMIIDANANDYIAGWIKGGTSFTPSIETQMMTVVRIDE